MNEKIKLFLEWALPILCAVNILLNLGNPALVLAWVVATTGWASHLINRYTTR